MGENFNIGEILESVDVIVTGNSYTKQNKNKIINKAIDNQILRHE